MTREELFELHKETCEKCYEILVKKNHDYSGASDDAFANFRNSEIFDVPGEIGILMRCIDKFKRIEAFSRAGELHVENESVDDAIEDVINYMILLKGLIRDKQEK